MMNSLLGKKQELPDIEPDSLTVENVEDALASDNKVKLAGIDVDGQSLPSSPVIELN